MGRATSRAAGSVKWAAAGPGAAYLYVRPDVLPKLEPMATGWFGHAEPFAFDMGPMRYANDAWRMIGGTMPVPAMYTARAGGRWSTQLGVDRIRRSRCGRPACCASSSRSAASR